MADVVSWLIFGAGLVTGVVLTVGVALVFARR